MGKKVLAAAFAVGLLTGFAKDQAVCRAENRGGGPQEKVIEGTIFVPPSGPKEKQTLERDKVELYAGPATKPTGRWKLTPGMARIDGDILTVEVDEKGLAASKGHAYPSGRLPIDLSGFRGGIEVSVRARAEKVVGKGNPWIGFKFQMPYADRLSGQPFWAEPPGCAGSFDWKTFMFRADLSTKDVPSAELMLGLQDATGTAVYDLSTLTVRPLRGAFTPVMNRDYRQVYSDRVKRWPQLRGAMLPAADRIREKDFADLRSWGATLVRYQMGMAPGENASDLVAYRKWADRMAEKLTRDLIPWARKHGLMICVDLHSNPGGRFGGRDSMMFHNRAAADCFVETWQKLARRAKGNGDVIYGYDLVNEPMQTEVGVTDYFSLQKRAAEAIRAIDPETPIVIESNMMDSPEQFSYLPALELEDVIYQVHMYVPGGYTHQGLASANSPARPKYPDPERGWNREFLKKALCPVRDFEQRHGARIFVGEFSAMCYAEGADKYIADCISIFKEYGWDWAYHAFREWDGWSVEHTTRDGIKEPKDFIPSADNPRKRVLIRGLKGE